MLRTISLRRTLLSILICTSFLIPSITAPAKAEHLAAGQLIKGSTSAVYYYTRTGGRLAFPTEKTFKTWYEDFSNVVQISDTTLADIPLKGNVTYCPGKRLVKIATDPKVYAVATGGVLRWIQTESLARELYGANWSQQIDDIPDAFFTNYSVGNTISRTQDYSPNTETTHSSIEGSLTTITPPTTTPLVSQKTDVTFTIQVNASGSPISDYIYGQNDRTKTKNGQDRISRLTLYRKGGNRFTTYNWENNASNSGIDWGPHSNDGYLSQSNTPADVMTKAVQDTQSKGGVTLLTVPIVDYVAADKLGLVTEKASDSSTRWVRNYATKTSILSQTPSVKDRAVYQDEFIHFMNKTFGNDANIFYSLDNEPGLWPSTHPLLHPTATTFKEMAERTTSFATMIKEHAPQSTVFGAVAYGYAEYVNLQSAPDQNGRDYLNFFLDTAKKAEASAGRRVVDVLDLHWYPEARGGGKRVVENGAHPSEAEINARVQAPRSLWDPSYKEDSWIANDVVGGPIALLPWLKQKIAQHYPGTKLAITEYYYGGAEHISGGIAQADVLGIFGRDGVFAAAIWPMWTDASSYIYGAFDMFLNYDNAGHSVGSISLPATTSDITKTSIYAMTSDANRSELTAVAINKTPTPLTVDIALTANQSYTSAKAYQLTSASSTPTPAATPTLSSNRLTLTLPAMSVTTIVVK